MSSHASHLPSKTNERSILYRRIATALGALVVGRAVPPLTSRMLLKAFCTPTVRLAPTDRQRAVLDRGERFTWRVGDATATGWRWGCGPAVVLAHGWAGRAAQLTAWVDELTARGFSVIAFDQPAHGESPGSSTHAVEMQEMLLALGEQTGPLAGLVAHSLGGLVASYALSRGLEADAVVLVSSPAAPGPYFERLMKMVRIPRARRATVREGAEALFGGTFEEVAIRNTWRGRTTPLLVVHDRDDRQVPAKATAEIRAAAPHAEVLETEGLGHNRILADPDVVRRGAQFIAAVSREADRQPLGAGLARRMSAAGRVEAPLVSTEEIMADLAFGRG